MKLVRNTTDDGKCKYALVRLDKLRNLRGGSPNDVYHQSLNILKQGGYLEYAGKNDPEEAFTIKLKDINAPASLLRYAEVARATDPELADDVMELVVRSERMTRKRPD